MVWGCWFFVFFFFLSKGDLHTRVSCANAGDWPSSRGLVRIAWPTPAAQQQPVLPGVALLSDTRKHGEDQDTVGRRLPQPRSRWADPVAFILCIGPVDHREPAWPAAVVPLGGRGYRAGLFGGGCEADDTLDRTARPGWVGSSGLWSHAARPAGLGLGRVPAP